MAKQPTTPRRDQTTPAKLERSIIKDSKQKAVSLENENYGSLILWRSTGDWWKMGANSALIYAYHVGPNILEKKNIQIHIDTDRFCPCPVGIVSVRDIEDLTENLAAHGIKKSKKSTETVAIFTLKTSLTESQLKHFALLEHGNRQKINQILRASCQDPHLDTEILRATEIAYNVVHKFDDKRMAFVGRRIYDEIITIYQYKNRIGREEIDPEEGFRQIYRHAGDLATLIDVAYELNFFATSRVENLARHINQILIESGNQINRIRKNKDKTENAA